MSGLKAKQNTLKKIREALSHSVPLPFPQSEGGQSLFEGIIDDEDISFAKQFSVLGGKFAFCSNIIELKAELVKLFTTRNWKNVFFETPGMNHTIPTDYHHYEDLASCEAAVTSCECLVARTGSMVLSSLNGGRAASAYCPVHICIAFSNQVMPDIKDAFSYLKSKYPSGLPSFITFASGPSRTADIEKTLVTGVHGPKEVFCFLVDTDQ